MEKKSYKLWIIVEEQTTNTETGEETYKDLKDEETRSVGHFDTLEEAIKRMEEIGEIYVGDFREEQD